MNSSAAGQSILVTGGAGYIGSHVCVLLLEAGYPVVVLDNFSNSHPEALRRVAQISGREPLLVQGDINDRALLARLFAEHDIGAVMHFAGLKAVGESVREPLRYYHNNVTGSLNLLQAMEAAGVRQIVFSSSATVYGEPASNPIDEGFPTAPTNPYGRNKLQVEQILQDLHTADPDWQIAVLRYFNPVGAHPCGLIGEDPADIPNNLMPYIAQVACGKLAELQVFGDDYDTPDGTGVRDYIHVMDLARGHLAALAKLRERPGCRVWNLGTGRGYSVLEMVEAFAEASGRNIPYRVTRRRAGDIATCYAEPARARRELGWAADKSLAAMCEDAWRWQSQNPGGYASEDV